MFAVYHDNFCHTSQYWIVPQESRVADQAKVAAVRVRGRNLGGGGNVQTVFSVIGVKIG